MNIQGRLGGVECGLMKAGLVYSWCSNYTTLLLAGRLTKPKSLPMNIQGRLGGVGVWADEGWSGVQLVQPLRYLWLAD
jgi:hypothetical protein